MAAGISTCSKSWQCVSIATCLGPQTWTGKTGLTFCIERVDGKRSVAGLRTLSALLLCILHAEPMGPEANVCATCMVRRSTQATSSALWKPGRCRHGMLAESVG